jgi:hypothetical protein
MTSRVWIAGSACLAIAGAALAQAGIEPPNVDPSRVIRAAEATERPFSDPGNAGAKAVAEAEGISVGEATSRLQRQKALNQFINRLQQRNPDLFSFVIDRGGTLEIGLTDPNVDVSDLLPPGLTGIRKYRRSTLVQGCTGSWTRSLLS